jgi:hypothetical protein
MVSPNVLIQKSTLAYEHPLQHLVSVQEYFPLLRGPTPHPPGCRSNASIPSNAVNCEYPSCLFQVAVHRLRPVGAYDFRHVTKVHPIGGDLS